MDFEAEELEKALEEELGVKKPGKPLFKIFLGVPAVILLAVAVTLLEAPCSLPIYAGTATILAGSGLPLPGVIGYFLYYNFLFVLPLLVILFLTWKGKQIVELKEWEHKHKKTMKLSIGLLLVLMAFYLLFF